MVESRVIISREQVLSRIRSEYLEMPGLRLTCAQAQRLWGLDEQTCVQLLDSLMEAGFLYRTRDGRYARVSDGAVAFPPLRIENADCAGPRTVATRAVTSARER